MSDEAKILSFVAFCIECYKRQKGISGEEAAAVFRRFGVERYLYEEYDVLHSMSEAMVLDYVNRFIAVREVGQ